MKPADLLPGDCVLPAPDSGAPPWMVISVEEDRLRTMSLITGAVGQYGFDVSSIHFYGEVQVIRGGKNVNKGHR